MLTHLADFDGKTGQNRVLLMPPSIAFTPLADRFKIGDRVWLTDGRIAAQGTLVHDSFHGMLGEPDWETLIRVELVTLPPWPEIVFSGDAIFHRVLTGVQAMLVTVEGRLDIIDPGSGSPCCFVQIDGTPLAVILHEKLGVHAINYPYKPVVRVRITIERLEEKTDGK